MEEKCSPIVAKAYQGAGGPDGDSEDDEDLEDHDEL